MQTEQKHLHFSLDGEFITKAQCELLYDYYTKHNMADKANDLYE